MRLLGTIQGAEIIETTDGRVAFIADADIDCDGSGGNPDKDPFFQAATTLRQGGKSLNAYRERFVVVPPVVVLKTRGIVMGCQAFVTNLRTGKVITAVVGDLGPTKKIGELSCACADALGINPHPNTGGTSERIVGYEIIPGMPALVEGTTYDLQAYKGGAWA